MLSLGIGDVSKLFYVGTPWHYSDLSQWLLDPKLSGIKHANIVIATVVGHDGIPLYPKGSATKRGEHPGFTPRSLKRLKNQQEARGLWSSQYLIQPISSSQQSFKPEWYRWYTKVPEDRPLATVMTCDPAISMEKQGDYTAFIVCTFDHEGNWYIREAVRHRAMGVPYIIETVYDLYNRYKYMGPGHRISLIGIETIGFQKTLLTIFNQMWARGEREELPIMPSLEPSKTVSKEFRIKRVTNHLKTGKIYLPAADPGAPLDMANQRYAMPEGFQALISEGERFPKSSHDDMLDALAYVMELPLYPEPPEEQEPETLVQRCRRGFKQARGSMDYIDPVIGKVGVDW
jgi:predicted phage terminase large subunit-like protein